jgi:vancomycin resistance protein YoaR
MNVPALRIGQLRIDRLLVLLALVSVASTVTVALGAFTFRLVRSGSLPGAEIYGVEVGGLGEDALRRALARLGTDRGTERIRLSRSSTEGRARTALSFRRAAAGYSLDVDRTVERVLARGRQANPYAALWDHVRAVAGATTIQPVERVDERALARWAAGAARQLSVMPREGNLRIHGTTIRTRYPAPGAVVDPRALARRVHAALLREEDEIAVEAEPAPPATDDGDVDRVATKAEQAVSAPVILEREGVQVTLSAREIGSMLGVRIRGDDLVLIVRPPRLRASLSAADIARVETDPVDATFALSGGSVSVVPAAPGFSVAPKKTARRVLAAATSGGERRAELAGRRVPAAFTTKDARELNITEQVSSFTTYHTCCEPRVSNIHRIADLMDGIVVTPGETFSLNGHVGPRTRANGFVAAPAIADSEFVEEVGGGISQFATTMFNAIYFGGYEFLEYQAHSYYIDRYPMGREATISNPAPDLAFRNDSAAGIYIDTSYTDTSITVTFYGNNDVEVESVTGSPYNRKAPPRECTVDKSLRPGEKRVISSGSSGFDVDVKRILIRNGSRSVEEFFTRYNPQPHIVERRRCRD